MAEFPRLYEPPAPDMGLDRALVRHFIGCLMTRGKRATAERVFRRALALIQKRLPRVDPLGVFTDAVECIRPTLEVRSKRVGGAWYPVPVPVGLARQECQALRWLVHAARARSGRPTARRLAEVILAEYWRPE
jgi:small subunit ribosomal protein S7